MITADLPERGWATRHTGRDLSGKPALFLDRDGTVIENVPYLDDPAKVCVIPGAREAIAAFRKKGYAVIIVTNQSGVARGLISPAQYRAVEAAVIEIIGPGLIDATYACPFLAEHPWRKPAPGMLLAAAQDHGLALAKSIMVGDSLADAMAGVGAGIARVVHIATGHGEHERTEIEAWAKKNEGPRVPTMNFAESLGDFLVAEIDK